MADRKEPVPIRGSLWEGLVAVIGIGSMLLLAIEHQFVPTAVPVSLAMLLVLTTFRQHGGTTVLGHLPYWIRPWLIGPILVAGGLTLYFLTSAVTAMSILFAAMLSGMGWHLYVQLRSGSDR